MPKKKEVKEANNVAFKLIATKGEDEILSFKFTINQLPEVMVKVLETSPQTILIVKSN